VIDKQMYKMVVFENECDMKIYAHI